MSRFIRPGAGFGGSPSSTRSRARPPSSRSSPLLAGSGRDAYAAIIQAQQAALAAKVAAVTAAAAVGLAMGLFAQQRLVYSFDARPPRGGRLQRQGDAGAASTSLRAARCASRRRAAWRALRARGLSGEVVGEASPTAELGVAFIVQSATAISASS